MNRIGIIQGRLSPRPFPKLQEFPRSTWRQEFDRAAALGFEYLEWIFEIEGYEDNPIWTSEGRSLIKKAISETGIPVASVCADYFLERPFYRCVGYTFEDNVEKLIKLIEHSAEIGASAILLPVLEGAEIRTEQEGESLVRAVRTCIPTLERCDVTLGFETELDASDYLRLCEVFDTPYVGAYYDTGNCAACGHDMATDMALLASHVVHVHVKDRLRHGPSVRLGSGDTNFIEGVPLLLDAGFQGNFTLQTYFGNDYIDDARNALGYMRTLVGRRDV